MDKNILILLDNLEDNWVAGINKTQDRYHLITFDVSPRQAFIKYRELLSTGWEKIVLIDTLDISRIAEKEAREYYLKLIKTFPIQNTSRGSSLLEALSHQGRNLWWYLNISEKNIWNDKLVHRLYALLRVLYALEAGKYDDVHLYVKDSVLRGAIINLLRSKGIKYADMQKDVGLGKPKRGLLSFAFLYFSQVCRELIKIVLKLSLLKLLGIKSATEIPCGSIGFFSIFPSWWKDPFSENAREIFFNTIPNEISKSEGVRHIVWIAPWRSLFWEGRRVAAFCKAAGVTVLETMMKPRDVLCLLDLAVFFKFLRAWKITNEAPLRIKGVAISEFLQEELYESLISPMFFQCLLLDRCLQRVPVERFKVFFLG